MHSTTQPRAAQQGLTDFFHLMRVADKLQARLPEEVRERINEPFNDVYCQVLDAIVSSLAPVTLDDVRTYEPCLQGPALIYMIDKCLEQRPEDITFWEKNRWRESLYDWDETGFVIQQILTDPQVRSTEHVLVWFQSRDASLLPHTRLVLNGHGALR